MDPRSKASLLWGAVGLLSFLVLIQGYDLLATARVSAGAKAAVAVLVGVAGAGSSYLAYGWLQGRR